MSEAAPAPQAQPEPEAAPAKKPAAPTIEERDFNKVLKGLLGKIVMFVNPESFEEGGLGYTLDAGWYKGKLTGVGEDYLIVLSEFKHGTGKNATKEPIKQYVPVRHIKRVTIMKTQILIHI